MIKMKNKIITIIILGIFLVSLVSAYDFTITPRDANSVLIEYENYTGYFMSYDRWCSNLIRSDENYVCDRNNYDLELETQTNANIEDNNNVGEEETEIAGNMVVTGYIEAEGFYDGTAGIENKTIDQYANVLGDIKNNRDGSLNDTTLPDRWKATLDNGETRRDISTMLSDFMGLFYRLVLGHQNQQQEIDNIHTETCQLNNGFSWC